MKTIFRQFFTAVALLTLTAGFSFALEPVLPSAKDATKAAVATEKTKVAPSLTPPSLPLKPRLQSLQPRLMQPRTQQRPPRQKLVPRLIPPRLPSSLSSSTSIQPPMPN